MDELQRIQGLGIGCIHIFSKYVFGRLYLRKEKVANCNWGSKSRLKPVQEQDSLVVVEQAVYKILLDKQTSFYFNI